MPYIPYMSKKKKAKKQTLDELIRQKAPKLDGLKLERVVVKREPPKVDPRVSLYVPFSPESDYKPADAYKKGIEKFAKPGIDKDYLLLASVRKLSESKNYNAATVVTDLVRYEHCGLQEQLQEHGDELRKLDKKARQEKVEEIAEALSRHNLKNYRKNLETTVNNLNSAWAETRVPPRVTPPYKIDALEDAENLETDKEGRFRDYGEMVGSFVAEYSDFKTTDIRNFNAGNRIYVVRYSKDGKDIDAVEIWKKKKS